MILHLTLRNNDYIYIYICTNIGLIIIITARQGIVSFLSLFLISDCDI